MATITIRRDALGKVFFDPPEITIAAKGDFVIWTNEDPKDDHQPTLEKQDPFYWMKYPLPKAVPGQPAACSPVINLAGVPTSSITYVDGLDLAPDPTKAVKGTIKFV